MQPYPPQGYPPQPPQQYAPAPQAPQYPPAPPQYGPPQPAPQYAPPAAPQYAPQQQPGGVPQVHAPAPPQATIKRPRMRDFARDNRLVLIKPLKIDRGVPNTKGKPGDVQDRLTCDVVILDGPPLAFGGKPEEGIPHDTQVMPPYEILGLFISSAPLLSQVERHMGEYVAGRLSIRQLPNGNTAYRLSTDTTEQDKALWTQYLVAKVSGQINTPQPEVPQAPSQPAPQAPPMAPPAPQYAPAVPQGQPQYAPTPQAMPQAPQQWAPPPPAAPQLDIDTPPVGWTVEQWMAYPPEQRMMWAQQAQQRPGV